MKTTLNQDIDAVVQVLRKGWCQEASAKNRRGDFVSSYSPSAVRWCAYGAMECTGTNVGERYGRLSLCFKRTHGVGPVTYNDSVATSKAGIIAAFLACKTKPRTKRIKH